MSLDLATRVTPEQAAVVSKPCWELFEEQDDDYRRSVLGTAVRVGTEAGARLGWDRRIGERGTFIGIASFGAPGSADRPYAHFGITPQAAAAAVRDLLARED
jgi:transketolase